MTYIVRYMRIKILLQNVNPMSTLQNSVNHFRTCLDNNDNDPQTTPAESSDLSLPLSSSDPFKLTRAAAYPTLL